MAGIEFIDLLTGSARPGSASTSPGEPVALTTLSRQRLRSLVVLARRERENALARVRLVDGRLAVVLDWLAVAQHLPDCQMDPPPAGKVWLLGCSCGLEDARRAAAGEDGNDPGATIATGEDDDQYDEE